MKTLLAAFLSAAAMLPAHALDVAQERARIAAERSGVAQRFAAKEKECYGRFAVSDCVNAARSERREALADLRRQELALNDADRKERAARRLREIEERLSPERQAQAEKERAASLEQQRQREARAAEKRAAAAAAPTASAPASTARAQPAPAARKPAKPPREPRPQVDRSAQEAQSRQAHEERLRQAQARKAKVDKRLAERTKPPAAPLPVPAR